MHAARSSFARRSLRRRWGVFLVAGWSVAAGAPPARALDSCGHTTVHDRVGRLHRRDADTARYLRPADSGHDTPRDRGPSFIPTRNPASELERPRRDAHTTGYVDATDC